MFYNFELLYFINQKILFCQTNLFLNVEAVKFVLKRNEIFFDSSCRYDNSFTPTIFYDPPIFFYYRFCPRC